MGLRLPKIINLASKVEEAGQALARLFSTNSHTSIREYRNMFKKVAIARQCVVLLSDFSVATGSEAQLKPINSNDTYDYSVIKQKIDEVNRNINLDNVLKVAEINRHVFGRAGFEKVRDDQGFIARMVPLRPEDLTPKVENFELKRVEYPDVIDSDGLPGYDPKNIFYITNLDIDGSYVGVSDFEAIKETWETRYNLELDLRESAEKLWAPIFLAEMDTSGMTDEEETAAFKDFISQLKPGRSVVYNKSVEAQAVNISPDLQSLTVAMSRIDEDLIGSFGIPKALLAREKCFAGETEFIDSSTGELIEFKSLKKPVETYTFNDETRGFEKTTDIVSIFAQDNPKMIIKLTTKKGYELRVSDDHPVLTKRGWIRAAGITPKDSIAIAAKIDLPEVIDLSNDLAFLLGIIISEGAIFVTKAPNGNPFTRIAITNFDEQLLDEIASCIPVNYSLSTSKKGEGKIIINGKSAEKLLKMYKDVGIDLPVGVHAREKRLPSRIYGLTMKAKKEFLKGYLAGDGNFSFTTHTWKVVMSSASYKLLSDLRWLLSGFGCITTISPTRTTYNLELYGFWAHRLLSQLGNFLWRKNWLTCLQETKYSVTHEEIDGNICWLPVKSVEVEDYEIVYDLEMPHHHNIIANQVIAARTMNRATLEFSLKALYEGPVRGIQRYLKREIERQIYDDVVRTYDQVYHTNFTQRIRISHMFKPIPIYDTDLLNTLAKFYQLGLISAKSIYEIIGWDPAKIPTELPNLKVLPPGEKSLQPTVDIAQPKTEKKQQETRQL